MGSGSGKIAGKELGAGFSACAWLSLQGKEYEPWTKSLK